MSICTQEELPPKVWETAKSSMPVTKARALSSVSRFLPDAASSALTSFSWSAAVPRETGSEPRVPQKRISMAGGFRSRGPVRGKGRGREFSERLAHASKARYHQGELADLEDFPDYRLQRCHCDRTALGSHLLGRDHQRAQADAADVFDPGKIEDHDVTARLALREVRLQGRLEALRACVIDPARCRQHQGVADAPLGQMHKVAPVLDGRLPGMIKRVSWAGTALPASFVIWRPL